MIKLISAMIVSAVPTALIGLAGWLYSTLCVPCVPFVLTAMAIMYVCFTGALLGAEVDA